MNFNTFSGFFHESVAFFTFYFFFSSNFRFNSAIVLAICRCRIPECDVDDNHDQHWLRNAIPHQFGDDDSPQKCVRYNLVKTRPPNETDEFCPASVFNTSDVIPCNDFVFRTDEHRIMKEVRGKNGLFVLSQARPLCPLHNKNLFFRLLHSLAFTATKTSTNWRWSAPLIISLSFWQCRLWDFYRTSRLSGTREATTRDNAFSFEIPDSGVVRCWLGPHFPVEYSASLKPSPRLIKHS